ncbi:hypothetical protein O6H91_16G050800 [Diphasiastrum complanatum]|uniref:Uncharacterized protein n=4 Tax=Diphasiastrum complanatum TaxID=34168 RepID=A0ACC2BD71_DIPCM|nr:hypothetical protein O6H91_Y343600 [Diphasiastrum complanatum]KAJ7284249.1 hypothetical protein O6H91_Y343600 [Diphasiastrum complanatum]KAJ7284250.1 hypothetical protein O6H91_Y343600 [Diphasiastrum complanatum]KAJ7284251.1 hypothetical protein O6H91_Y343600 [Diphasiastrum complanatum]KAJ7527369.1 hypothetical protein O6H91_16G050800 [Diphasiastrum complanatum]
MPSVSPSPTSNASMQFLNSVLSQGGPNALPYEEDVKWLIRQHLLTVIQEFPGLQVKTAIFTHNDGRTLNLLQADGTIPMYYQDVKYNIPVTTWLLESYPRSSPLVYVSPTRDMIIKPRHPYVDASGMVSAPYLQQWLYPLSNLVELVQNLSLLFGQDPPLYSRPASVPTWPPPPPQPFQGVNPIISGGMGTANPPPSAASYQQRPSHLPNPRPYHVSTQQQSFSLHPRPSRADDPSEVFKINAINSLTDRLQSDVLELRKSFEGEMDELFNTQALMNQRAEMLDKGICELQQEKEGLEEQLQLMLANTDVLETWLRNNDKGVRDFPIDDVFQPCDTLSKQMLECTAADLAIEDVLYSMDKAVQEGVISVEIYLKHVRMLSREQFFLRATVTKVRGAQLQAQVAGMAARAMPFSS